jgi:hypothetical protein
LPRPGGAGEVQRVSAVTTPLAFLLNAELSSARHDHKLPLNVI